MLQAAQIQPLVSAMVFQDRFLNRDKPDLNTTRREFCIRSLFAAPQGSQPMPGEAEGRHRLRLVNGGSIIVKEQWRSAMFGSWAWKSPNSGRILK